jgi:hypothetical protein
MTQRAVLGSGRTIYVLKPVKGKAPEVLHSTHISADAHAYVKRARVAFMSVSYYVLRTAQDRKVFLKCW